MVGWLLKFITLSSHIYTYDITIYPCLPCLFMLYMYPCPCILLYNFLSLLLGILTRYIWYCILESVYHQEWIAYLYYSLNFTCLSVTCIL